MLLRVRVGGRALLERFSRCPSSHPDGGRGCPHVVHGRGRMTIDRPSHLYIPETEENVGDFPTRHAIIACAKRGAPRGVVRRVAQSVSCIALQEPACEADLHTVDNCVTVPGYFLTPRATLLSAPPHQPSVRPPVFLMWSDFPPSFLHHAHRSNN